MQSELLASMHEVHVQRVLLAQPETQAGGLLSIKVLRICTCMCPTRLVPDSDTDPTVGHHGLGMPPHCTRVMHGSQTASSWPLEARFMHAPELLVLPDGNCSLYCTT